MLDARLKNEYEVDDKYQKYQELKTKETNCLAINSDFVYILYKWKSSWEKEFS